MTKTRKLTLLAATALAALAFAIPASASASEFQRNGNPIAGGGESETYQGSLTVTSAGGAGGVSCADVTVEFKFETNQAQAQSVEASECESFGSLLEMGCHVESGYMEVSPRQTGSFASFGPENPELGTVKYKEFYDCQYSFMAQDSQLNLSPNWESGSTPLDYFSISGTGSGFFGGVIVSGELSAAGSGGFEAVFN